MKVLVVGAAGFLGEALARDLSQTHEVLAADRQPIEADYASVVLDVGQFEAVHAALAGCDAFVNALMSGERGYVDGADIAFQADVHGTYCLFEAARQQGATMAVQISSGAVYGQHDVLTHYQLDTPQLPQTPYGLCKALQEHIGRFFAAQHGFAVTAFRPWGIMDRELGVYKQGQAMHDPSWWGNIDRHDIAEAVALALASPQPGFRAYHLPGTPEARERLECESIERDLGWRAH